MRITTRSFFVLAAAAVLAALGCNGAGAGSTNGSSASSATRSTTSAPTTATTTTTTTAPAAPKTTPASPSSGDPAFYATPAIAGVGVRTINVTPGGTPTLQQALDNALPGDTIVLAAGTHKVSSGNLVMRSSGTATAWIAIQGAKGARPVIDLSGAGELTLGGSYVCLDGVEIVNGGGNNLHVAPVSTSVQDVVVRNCKIHSLAAGPGAAIKINRNNSINAGVSLIYLEDNDLSQSIGNAVIDAVGCNQGVARGNYIHDNDPGSHGIFFKGGSSEILIEKNLICRITGNAALQLGGVTGSTFFDPAHASVEGFDQVARNNIIADCDDAIVQVQGVQHAKVHHNTALSQTTFAVFRLLAGSSATGAKSANDDVEITNNLIIATGGVPQYARNDAGAVNCRFGPQLWAGDFKNSSSAGVSVPTFPQKGDKVVASSALASVVANPSYASLTGLADALARFELASGSAAKGAGEADSLVAKDILDALRSSTAPSLGAFE